VVPGIDVGRLAGGRRGVLAVIDVAGWPAGGAVCWR
jgi:hypothetical protein